MLAHVGVSTSSRVVYFSPPDWNEMLAWSRLLGPNDLFVDVGASVGVYTLWATNFGARVVAIEPDVESLMMLEENIALNPGIKVDVVKAAITDTSGLVEFTSGCGATNRLGMGRTVEAVTIDDLLEDRHARGLKIDVEGFELQVLRGARQALHAHRIDVIQLEWNKRSLIALGVDRSPIADLLRSYGYRLTRPNRCGVLNGTAAGGFGDDVFAISPLLVESVQVRRS